MSKYFITCARGLESIAARELDQVGATNVEESRGGVHFEGDHAVLYKIHLWSRVGNRVMYPLREAVVRDAEDVYEMVKAFRWETFFRKPYTLAVDCTVSGMPPEGLRNSHFLRLRVKDAIVDRLREKTGVRPDVDIENADIQVYLYLRDHKAVFGLDATGPSMHERGYRSFGAEPDAMAPPVRAGVIRRPSAFTVAPLKESLAAGILGLSGWTPDRPLYDPLCGSGTFLLEAGLIATNTAPGLMRDHFLFMNWPDFYEKRWQDLCDEARASQTPLSSGLLFGSDRETAAIRLAQGASRRLGWDGQIGWETKDFRTISAAPSEHPGVLVCNPPYGERVGTKDSLGELYSGLGDLFKKSFKGWSAFVICEHGDLAKSIGLKPSRKVPLFNGPIECRLLKYDMY